MNLIDFRTHPQRAVIDNVGHLYSVINYYKLLAWKSNDYYIYSTQFR